MVAGSTPNCRLNRLLLCLHRTEAEVPLATIYRRSSRTIGPASPKSGTAAIGRKSGLAASAPVADIRQPVRNNTMTTTKAVGMSVFIVVICIWAYIALTGEPRLPIGIANGSYTNRCCGTLVLADGIMTLADQRVSYVI